MVRQRYLTLSDPFEPARPRHLCYLEWGDRENPDAVICMHGLSRRGHDFDVLARALSAKYRVICPDMAGRGNSSWLVRKSDYTYSLYISDTLRLLETLELSQVKWVGTSMGGITGMMIAAANKQLIKAMVLNDVGAIVSAQGLQRILSYVGVGDGVFGDMGAAVAYVKSVLAPFHITTDEQWRHMLGASLKRLADGRVALAYDPGISQPFRDAVSASGEIADVNLTPFWLGVECPVLLIRGQHSDILTADTAMGMQNSGKLVKYAEIEDTGHAPALLEASQVGLISNWLALQA